MLIILRGIKLYNTNKSMFEVIRCLSFFAFNPCLFAVMTIYAVICLFFSPESLFITEL